MTGKGGACRRAASGGVPATGPERETTGKDRALPASGSGEAQPGGRSSR